MVSNEKNILLSISFLASGRPEMKKCLKSIEPLLQKLNSELVVVDTGCNEEHKRLIKQYTDIIIDFEWCNDFSKARNAGLSQCNGQWFMFIDDDEWFENIDEIVNFFETEEYRKYNCASYIVRNYLQKNGKLYKDVYARRIYKTFDGMRFINPIHENINYMNNDSIMCEHNFQAYVHHYGYAYDNNEEKEVHSQRNRKILFDALGHDEDNFQLRLQLVGQYIEDEEWEKAIECANRTFELNSKYNYSNYEIILGDLYCAKLLSCYEAGKESELVLTWKEMQNQKSIPDASKGVSYVHMSRYFYKKRDFREVLKLCNLYFSIFEKYEKDRYKIIEKCGIISSDPFAKIYYETIRDLCIMSDLELGSYEMLHTYFKEIPWLDKNLFFYNGFIEKVCDAIADNTNDGRFKKYLKKIMSREESANKALFNLEKHGIENSDYYDKFLLALKQIKIDKLYMERLQKIEESYMLCYADEKERREYVVKILADSMNIFELTSEIWDVIFLYNIDISNNLKAIDLSVFKENLQILKGNNDYFLWKLYDNILSEAYEIDDCRYIAFRLMYLEYKLLTICNESSYSHIYNVLSDYANYYINNWCDIYEDDQSMEYLFSLHLEELLSFVDCGDYKGAFEKIKECFGICHEYDEILKIFSSKYAEAVKNAELLSLISQTKTQIVMLADNGHIVEARQFLSQVMNIEANGDDIPELIKKVYIDSNEKIDVVLTYENFLSVVEIIIDSCIMNNMTSLETVNRIRQLVLVDDEERVYGVYVLLKIYGLVEAANIVWDDLPSKSKSEIWHIEKR